MFLFLASNTGVGAYYWITFSVKAPSYWVPVAKTAGGLLNLNSVFILLPVLKSVNKFLNELQVGA